MQQSWLKIINYVGTIHGSDISNELEHRIRVTIPVPKHEQSILDRHELYVQHLEQQHNIMDIARQAELLELQAD